MHKFEEALEGLALLKVGPGRLKASADRSLTLFSKNKNKFSISTNSKLCSDFSLSRQVVFAHRISYFCCSQTFNHIQFSQNNLLC
jgi:hypothetical protein